MNRKPLILTAAVALLAIASAGTAFAGEASDDALAGFHASKTRREVVAELQQARADGSIHASDIGYHEVVRQSRARAEVKAETRVAVARGEVDDLSREHATFTVAAIPSQRSSH